MGQNIKPTRSSLREKLIIIIMISSVFIGIYLALSSWFSMQNSEWLSNRKEKRIIQTQNLATNADSDYFIIRKILPLIRHICEDKDLDIKATQENFLNKYDLDISIFKFDRDKLIETAPANVGNKWLMRNLYPALLEKNIKKIESKQKELDKKIEFAFGYGKNLLSIQKNPETIIKSVVDGKESFYVWSNRGDKGVIIYCNRPPNKDKILNEVIKSTNFLPNQIFAGRLNENELSLQASLTNNDSYDSTKTTQSFTLARSLLRQPSATPSPQGVVLEPHYSSPTTYHQSLITNHAEALASAPSSLSPSSLLSLQAYKHLAKNSLEQGIFENLEWYFVTTRNNEIYFTVYEQANSTYYKCITYFKLFFAITILLTIIVILNYPNDSILNLKKLVTLIFIASSILPLTITGTSSLESIDTLISINKNELSSSIEETIGNIVQNFNNYTISCSDELSILLAPPKEGFKTKESIEALAQKVLEKYPGAQIIARNSIGDIIYSNSARASQGQETLFKSICYRYIEKYNKERIGEKEYSGNPFSDSLVKQDDLAFSAICSYPDQLQLIRVGGFPIFLFIKTYEAKYGEIAFIEVQPQLTKVLKKYTQSINRRNLVTKQQYINLAAFNPLNFKWSIIPQEFTKNLFEQAKASYVINKPIFRKITIKGKQIYSLSVPNSTYEDICYIGYLSTEIFDEKINRLKFYILVGAIVATILLFAIIGWLMKQIIAPLANLETGIKALSEHKYEVKIPVPEGKDELSTLFKEFNFMMGENYDMQMAKNVQEGLLTTKFPVINDYYINGYSIPAGDLGGDCLTSFSLPDGKILFLVGDLTGHSIGSALMMSFVRSVTFNWSQNPNDTPSSLADSIDKMLRDNQMKHMFMGIICGILDPQNGQMNFITRGHIYPLFIRNDGTVEWLGSPALPLGIGKKHETKEQTTLLLPGERLLCISDGIIEIHKGNGLTITYKQIENWAKENIEKDNTEWLKSIESKYREWCDEHKAVQTDDLTLFTIIRDRSKQILAV